MPNPTALTRGDRRRNEKLAGLRAVVRPELAIVAVDLADAKQAAVVADHDSVIVAKRMFDGSAWCVDEILDWAGPVAAAAGFAGVVLACEPTGHRWKPLLERASARGVRLACVQPLLTHRGREGEDFTRDRSDFKDAVIIARLVAERRCYLPVAQTGEWARLRHLGQRRSMVMVRVGADRQCLADLLACAWPTVLAAAAKPLESLTWRAAMSVSTDPAVIAAMTLEDFAAAVAARLAAWGGQRRHWGILRAVHAAAGDPGGIAAERSGACERAGFALADWHRDLADLAAVEDLMVGVLDRLELTSLVTSIDGLSAIGAAAILAETGDPARYDCARTWVKHAGVCPRANESGTFRGQTTISGRGRPALRTAAWRAVWGALPNNAVYAARYQHLRTRTANPLTDNQARVALAAALLRQLFVVVTRRVAWDARLAGAAPGQEVTATAA